MNLECGRGLLQSPCPFSACWGRRTHIPVSCSTTKPSDPRMNFVSCLYLPLGPWEKEGILLMSPPGRNFSNHSTFGEWEVAAPSAKTGDHRLSAQEGKWSFSEPGVSRRGRWP